MDFKKLAGFIIVIGLIILAVGGVRYNCPSTEEKEYRRSRWDADIADHLKQDRRKSATNIMVAGALVGFVGVGVMASAKKKND